MRPEAERLDKFALQNVKLPVICTLLVNEILPDTLRLLEILTLLLNEVAPITPRVP